MCNKLTKNKKRNSKKNKSKEELAGQLDLEVNDVRHMYTAAMCEGSRLRSGQNEQSNARCQDSAQMIRPVPTKCLLTKQAYSMIFIDNGTA